ncbi:hypothetical protein SRHO_G00228660 [Serrasalmus rhombeus]
MPLLHAARESVMPMLQGQTSSSSLTDADQYRLAERVVLQRAQQQSFPEEYELLAADKPITSRSCLLTLAPVMDKAMNLIRSRQKWYSSPPELQNQAVVMLRDPQLPWALWPIGRVVKVHRSDDGYIRSADVSIKGQVYTWPVARLVMLPALLSEEDDTS